MNHFDNSTYYHYKLIFNSKITHKIKRYFIVFMLLALFVCTFVLIQLYTFYQIPPQKTEVILLQFLCGFICVPILHHLLHGIGYITAGIRPKMQISNQTGFPLLVWSTELIISKKQKIFILLTPIILGTGIITLSLSLFPEIWFFSAIIFAFHLPLCLPDIYWSHRIHKMHPEVIIRNTQQGFSVYKI